MAEFAAKGAERANEGFGKAQNEAAKAKGLTYSAASKGARPRKCQTKLVNDFRREQLRASKRTSQ
jgi:hypothetical protein